MRIYTTKSALEFIRKTFGPMSLKTFYRLAPKALKREMRRSEVYSEAQLVQIVEYQRTQITVSRTQQKRRETQKLNRGAV